ncbi:MAG: hypothetical protein ACM3MK_03260 [Chitinophagales bacterium]
MKSQVTLGLNPIRSGSANVFSGLIVDYLTGKYAAGVAVYDDIEKQTLEMADMMAEGIFKKFLAGLRYSHCDDKGDGSRLLKR